MTSAWIRDTYAARDDRGERPVGEVAPLRREGTDALRVGSQGKVAGWLASPPVNPKVVEQTRHLAARRRWTRLPKPDKEA